LAAFGLGCCHEIVKLFDPRIMTRPKRREIKIRASAHRLPGFGGGALDYAVEAFDKLRLGHSADGAIVIKEGL
jgi:hypothetical protein